MKTEIIKNSSDIFQPIEIKFTIESQAELDALVLARKYLFMNEINDVYDLNTRRIWVKALFQLGGLLP